MLQSHLPYQCRLCRRRTKTARGLKMHFNSVHRDITPPADDDRAEDHSYTYARHTIFTAKPCDENGVYLPPYAPPAHAEPIHENPWSPFDDRIEFDFANFHFATAQSSAQEINIALDLWAASLLKCKNHDVNVPWKKAQDLYKTIDKIQQGSSPWKVYKIRYSGPMPPVPPRWMTQTYELCTRDSRAVLHQQLATEDFKDKIHYAPYMQFDSNGRRVRSNLMSADWPWKEAKLISDEVGPEADGAILVPIVSGSDKTTVSVATGQQAYHPVYISPGGITNLARRAHGNGVLPVGFLPIPKTSKKHRKKPEYAKFTRQLYHACLTRIFAPLKKGMTTAEIVRCPDGHLRRAFYSLGPYIADYPEQVWLAGIVQNWCPKCDAHPDFLDDADALRRSHRMTDFLITCFDPGILWDDYGIRCDVVPFTQFFPRADIHELLTPDLLHQVIKGAFKDHLVEWVGEYLVLTHGEAGAYEKIQDIDRRISAVPPFPGLRRFPDGRDFSQWTGDDSKALMKVYLAAIAGHVPRKMVQCFSAFLDFCYYVRRNSFTTQDIDKLEYHLDRFHDLRRIFIETGVRTDISLPRQHALKHYSRSIRLFGSPNGLCSSITESKHVKAVKEPWRRSNRWEALSQMLQTICRLEKLQAAARTFSLKGMLSGSTSSYTSMILAGGEPVPMSQLDDPSDDEEDDDLGPVEGPKVLSSIRLANSRARSYPRDLNDLAAHIGQPRLPAALRRFLWDRENPDSELSPEDVPLDDCPIFHGKISVFHSAVARFYAPSDICGAGGMSRERIRSNPSWRGLYARHDTAFVEIDADLSGMAGMAIARVLMFFSFFFRDIHYPCALVHWLVPSGEEADQDTGMWVVKPEFEGNRRTLAVIHLDSIVRAAHLLPVYGSSLLPEEFPFSLSLDVFHSYFVNSYVDHHAHEFLQ